ncbi:hypothetical protein B0T19DRAFT_297840 [Cercophora scortea]|uniref:Terpene cyclase n=1 Tax=Cercophora scortea TaxID=314031 RepID=A0AAE0I433_9PEZI|nr:hypothetical protein B0T19DRAFT_297840 [Cercophora scortea]
MGFHLPLSPIDAVNQPPLYFLYVQDGAILLMGTLWTIAYVLYIKQGFKDKSYGMPIVALCANIGWELIYGVFFPPSVAEMLMFVPWFFIDLVVVYTTIKFGPEQWKQSPLVANNLKTILGFGTVISFLLHLALIKTCASPDDAGFWSGFSCQILLGFSSVAHLLSRDNTSGHSWSIWWCRRIGSFAATVLFTWRYWFYPLDYPLVATPMAIFIFASAELADIMYAVVYWNIEKRELARKAKTQ